jgi:hypothetical protein
MPGAHVGRAPGDRNAPGTAPQGTPGESRGVIPGAEGAALQSPGCEFRALLPVPFKIRSFHLLFPGHPGYWKFCQYPDPGIG